MQHLIVRQGRTAATPNRAWANLALCPVTIANASSKLDGVAVVLPFIGGGLSEDSPLGCTSHRVRGWLKRVP